MAAPLGIKCICLVVHGPCAEHGRDVAQRVAVDGVRGTYAAFVRHPGAIRVGRITQETIYMMMLAGPGKRNQT